MEEVLKNLKKVSKGEFICKISFERRDVNIKLKRGFDKYLALRGKTIREFSSIEVGDRIFNFDWLDDKTLHSVKEVLTERDFSKVEKLIYNIFRDSKPCPICNNSTTKIIDEYVDGGLDAEEYNYHLRKKCYTCNHEWDTNSIREI